MSLEPGLQPSWKVDQQVTLIIRASGKNSWRISAEVPPRPVRIHLTSAQFGSKHGQASPTGIIEEFAFVRQIRTVNANSLMKPVRVA